MVVAAAERPRPDWGGGLYSPATTDDISPPPTTPRHSETKQKHRQKRKNCVYKIRGKGESKINIYKNAKPGEFL